MIKTIARKEFIETLRDGRFRVSLFIALALLLASLLLGWKGWSEVHAQRETAQKTVRAQWLNQGEKNPHGAAHYGVYAFRPTPLLSFVEPGIHPYTGVAVWLEAHKQNDFQGRPARDSTALGRFGSLNAAFVMQVLLPLLIVLLAFGIFAAERENGTMRQVLSLGVTKTTWALGKMLGLVTALMVLLLPATVVGVAILMFSAGEVTPSDSLSRMASMAVGYALYFGVFIGVAMAVSAHAKSSRSALVVLLGFWMVNCLLLPRVASDLARKIHPTPSAFAFSEQLAKDIKHDQEKRRQQLEAKVLQKYKVKTLEALPVNFAGIALQAGEEHGYRVFDARYAQLWGIIERQNSLNQMMAMVAPLLATRNWSMAMAGTDFAQHRRFAEASERYRRLIQKTMNDEIIAHPAKGALLSGNTKLWARVPEFAYHSPGLNWVTAQQFPTLSVLVLWFVASVGLALWSANRLCVE